MVARTCTATSLSEMSSWAAALPTQHSANFFCFDGLIVLKDPAKNYILGI